LNKLQYSEKFAVLIHPRPCLYSRPDA